MTINPKKILSICYEYPPLGGGGAKVVDGLLSRIHQQGYEVDLVTMWYPGLPFKEVKEGVTIYRIPCIRVNQSVCYILEMPLYLLFALPVAIYLTIKNQYLLNHTHFIFPDGFLSMLLKFFTGLRYVITAHGSDVPGYNPDRFILAHQILSPFWKVVVKNAKVITCPSETIEKLIHEKLPATNTTVIPNGLDIQKFVPDRKKLDRILVVTRMFERKGVQYFLEAIEEANIDFEINIVGDGPYLPTLKEMASQKKLDVVFHGFLENTSQEFHDLFETSRIFVFTSEAENFPIVLLEAMAAGMAIITTEGTGCAEVVGDAGVLVEPKNSQAILEALQKLVADKERCETLGKKARERLEEHFGWKTVTSQYVDLFGKLSKSL